MEYLKKFWPTPFKIKEKDVKSFVIQLLIFLLICFVGGLLIGLLGAIPIVKIIAPIVGILLDVYGLVGIVLCILKFIGIDALK